MKVIKKGRDQKGWAKELECTGKGNGNGGCGAILLVEAGDVYKTARHSYDGSSETYATFDCCSCGVMTDIPDGDFPSRLKKQLKPRNGPSEVESE